MSTTTTPTSPTAETVLAEYQAALSAIPDPDDEPGNWSANQVRAAATRRVELRQQIAHLGATASLVAESTAAIQYERPWTDFLVHARTTLSDELMATSPRARNDHEAGTQMNLALSLRVIDQGPAMIDGSGYDLQTLRLGALMRDAGYHPLAPQPGQQIGRTPWRGSLPESEARLADLTKRLTDAQRELDELLLPPAERAALEQQRAAERAERNQRPTRKVRGDGSVFDKWPDGQITEVSA